GTGKTTLINKLLEHLGKQRISSAFIFNPRLNVHQFLDFMMTDFGIPNDGASTKTQKSQMLLRLNQWLLERYRRGETAVLIVDEAQNLSPQVLEEIRLLTNLETSTEKLLQIVLSGQPELEQKLNQPELRQLRQRITLRCKTYPLTLEETCGYVDERLHTAGAASAHGIFAPDSIERIHFYSRGIPRVINLLCEHALIGAFVDQRKTIAGEVIEEVAREFQLHEVDPMARPAKPDGNGENLHLMEALQNLATIVDRLRTRS
ncbi:MAG: AAA family ATPase, partial [Acidobacteria bacterium]|nr:AAA family ATPase [Acidobacteriota bacterium]